MLAVKDRSFQPQMGELLLLPNHRFNAANPSIWTKASTFPVVGILVFFAMNGLSPFVNDNMFLRFANAAPSNPSIIPRVVAWSVYLACCLSILQRHTTIVKHLFRLKALAFLPFFAIVSSMWSQLPLSSLNQGILLLGATLFAVAFTHNFTSREQMQLLMACGAITAVATVLFAVFLPRYGLDHLGGHESAWKGVFTAKNVCGQTMLLLLAPALYHKPRLLTTKLLQGAYILLLVGVILMSQATTSWIFLAFLLVGRFCARLVSRFGVKEVFLALGTSAVIIVAGSFAAYDNFGYLLGLLGKDSTLTGRTGLWHAAIVSIAKHPILGYGYAAFWNGLQGESASLLLSIRNYLSQPQNGFLDIWLQLGLGGLLLFTCTVVTVTWDLLHLLHARRMAFVHWYAAIVVLTLLFNLFESYLLFPRYLGWLLYLVACYGLNDMAHRERQMNDRRIPA